MSTASELASVRALIERYGEDSLAPFIARPDKAFRFAPDGVAAFTVLGRTAVVSGDPVGAVAAVPRLIAGMRRQQHACGRRIAIYGASARHLAAYRRLGLRAMKVGEEAVVLPQQFTLEGRPVRKLRQSVNRVAQRGWTIEARDGRDIDPALEHELGCVEAAWRRDQPEVQGFAMSMGESWPGINADDLYVYARAPDGRLCAAMHFFAHRGRLSLDTMRRVGETPNGLNEALICHTLKLARRRGVSEVSLNYAGLAHLVRNPPSGYLRGRCNGLLLAILGRRFQMDRLVRFNDKFAPEWRPRYLVYESRRALPRAVLAVLCAEGYLDAGRRHRAAAAAASATPPAVGVPVSGPPGVVAPGGAPPAPGAVLRPALELPR